MWHLLIYLLMFVAQAQALQVSGLAYQNTLKPGESAEVRITLISDKDKPELVDLKLCDYWCNAQGQHFFESVGEHARSNASWITQNSFRETINPGETRDVYLIIRAPQDKSLKGSYWSVLLIEPSDPLQSMVEAASGFQLQVKVRYAYHVVTNIGTGTPSIKIIKKGIEETFGKKQFAVHVDNNGDLFLSPKLIVKLFDKQGKLQRTLESQTERLYPGSSVRYLAAGEEIEPGSYTAFLLFDNGDGRIFADTFPFTIP